MAERLGVGEGTLGSWVRQARVDRGERAGVSTAERVELVELRRENARLRMERDLLKRATGFWVKESDSDPLSLGRCPEGRGVPDHHGLHGRRGEPPGVHDWRAKMAAGPTDVERAEGELVEVIRAIHTEFDGTYGEPRITEELARRGRPANHKRVERLRRAHGIIGVHKPAKVRTTIPAEDAPPLPDLIGRRFNPGRPDVAWVGDITYIATGAGWLYLASVLDLGSRRLLGYSMADHMRTELVADALTMAAGARGGATARIIFHGDRGSQYLSGDYRQLVTDLEMRQSVGRTGMCWDNSVAEAFWSSLKRELVHRYRFPERATARRAIFAWINRYNQLRLHSSLGYVPLNPRPTWPRNQRDRSTGERSHSPVE